MHAAAAVQVMPLMPPPPVQPQSQWCLNERHSLPLQK